MEGFFPLGGQVFGAKGIRKPPPAVQLFENPTLLELGNRHVKTPAQIVLRWGVQSEVIPLPKTTKKERLEENINIFDFQLSDMEMKAVDALNYDFSIAPDDDEVDQMHPEDQP